MLHVTLAGNERYSLSVRGVLSSCDRGRSELRIYRYRLFSDNVSHVTSRLADKRSAILINKLHKNKGDPPGLWIRGILLSTDEIVARHEKLASHERKYGDRPSK